MLWERRPRRELLWEHRCGSGALAAIFRSPLWERRPRRELLWEHRCGSGALAATPRYPLMNKTAIPKPHSQDLRKGRISEAGRIYLITTMIHERQPFFQDWRCGRLVVKALMGESPQRPRHWLLSSCRIICIGYFSLEKTPPCQRWYVMSNR